MRKKRYRLNVRRNKKVKNRKGKKKIKRKKKKEKMNEKKKMKERGRKGIGNNSISFLVIKANVTKVKRPLRMTNSFQKRRER